MQVKGSIKRSPQHPCDQPFSKLKTNALDNRLKSILKTTPKQLRAVEYFAVEPKKEAQIQSAIKESPVIHTVDPMEIVAGNKSLLTITGAGFGDTLGLVFFKNANNGDQSHFEILQTQIVSWTNTEIIVEVPSDAGTGPVIVVNGKSLEFVQTPSITITYAYLNFLHTDTKYHVKNGAFVEYIVHNIGGVDPLPENPPGNFSDDGAYVFPTMKTLQKMPMQYLLLKTDLTNWFAILEFDLKLMIKRLPQIHFKRIAPVS